MHNDIALPAASTREELLKKKGEELLTQGRVGAVILAGGQGTRLEWSGPKGTFPTSPIKHKSLFQLTSEKVLAAQNRYHQPLAFAVETAKKNDAATQVFFASHQNFGLPQSSFFPQPERPLLNMDGTPYIQEGKFRMAADGNGSFFWSFVSTGLCAEWEKQGIAYVSVFPIDNPLAIPFDAHLIGLCATGFDAALIGVERTSPDEHVGLIVAKNKKISVIEYTELPQELNSSPLPFLANISVFCFSISFIKKIARMRQETFPIHLATKYQKDLQCNMLKQEFFIFDMLSEAERSAVLFTPRNCCFAPLKNKIGPDSLTTCQEAIMHHERELFTALSQVPVEQERRIELSAAFYYPTDRLRTAWYKKPLPQDGYAS